MGVAIVHWKNLNKAIERTKDSVRNVWDWRKREIFECYARHIEPFVPAGIKVQVDSTGVFYTTTSGGNRYVHYLYKGKDMGPNIPVFAPGDTEHLGEPIGFVSPKRVKKHYTGKDISYKKGGPHWDETFRNSAEYQTFLVEAQEILSRGNKHGRT